MKAYAAVCTLVALSACSSTSPEQAPAPSEPIQLIHDPLTIKWQETLDGVHEPYIRVGNEFIHLAPGEPIGDPGPIVFDERK